MLSHSSGADANFEEIISPKIPHTWSDAHLAVCRIDLKSGDAAQENPVLEAAVGKRFESEYRRERSAVGLFSNPGEEGSLHP